MPKKTKMLQILKTKPDDLQIKLMSTLSLGYNCLQFPLFEEENEVDYEELLDLIFEYDEVITWW